jgi:FtsH-binding integral membrane protein
LDEILGSYTLHGLVATGIIVLEALILTAAVVVSLTAYTYWAASKGYDFSYLGPILFVGVIILILFGIIQVLFSTLDLAHPLWSLFSCSVACNGTISN